MRALVFPGQGSQAVGMGQELAAAFAPAREVFEEVDEALSQSLSTLMAEGPADTLTLTENAQPALMAVSMAVVRVLEKECGLDLTAIADRVAGHSLGEYSALAAAGSLSVTDTARLLRIRGQAMQAAVPVGEGAMAALLGLDADVAAAVAVEAEQQCAGRVCTAANDNAPGQVVISGHKDAVEAAIVLAKAKGCRRGMLLPVSAPFHCSLMAPAAEAMAEALADVTIAAPKIPLVANVTAGTVTDPEIIRGLLVDQVTGAVRWRESVLHMAELGITELLELGSGKVLSGMAKRIHADMTARAIQGPADVEAVVKTL